MNLNESQVSIIRGWLVGAGVHPDFAHKAAPTLARALMEAGIFEYRSEPLRRAAEQFLASCEDGNVTELIDYYKEIFTEALADVKD